MTGAARVPATLVARALAAVVLAAGAVFIGPAGGPAPVRAAMPALILVTTTIYEVLPVRVASPSPSRSGRRTGSRTR